MKRIVNMNTHVCEQVPTRGKNWGGGRVWMHYAVKKIKWMVIWSIMWSLKLQLIYIGPILRLVVTNKISYIGPITHVWKHFLIPKRNGDMMYQSIIWSLKSKFYVVHFPFEGWDHIKWTSFTVLLLDIKRPSNKGDNEDFS